MTSSFCGASRTGHEPRSVQAPCSSAWRYRRRFSRPSTSSGWRTACSGVTAAMRSAGQVRNGPPEAVSVIFSIAWTLRKIEKLKCRTVFGIDRESELPANRRPHGERPRPPRPHIPCLRAQQWRRVCRFQRRRKTCCADNRTHHHFGGPCARPRSAPRVRRELRSRYLEVHRPAPASTKCRQSPRAPAAVRAPAQPKVRHSSELLTPAGEKRSGRNVCVRNE